MPLPGIAGKGMTFFTCVRKFALVYFPSSLRATVTAELALSP